MMGRPGFGPFMPFGMGFFFLGGLFRLILPLGVLVLVAFLFYQLGKRSAGSAVAAAAPASSPEVAEEPRQKSGKGSKAK